MVYFYFNQTDIQLKNKTQMRIGHSESRLYVDITMHPFFITCWPGVKT